MRRLLMLGVLLTGFALVGCSGKSADDSTTGTKPAEGTTVGLNVGQTAPEIEGEDLDGKKFKLSDYRGKVVVLDFWGNW
jgi:cytochrome oxidase Cu insertion factor (SCO1/SenC/PrrC family)